jgi:hypothetical protein
VNDRYLFKIKVTQNSPKHFDSFLADIIIQTAPLPEEKEDAKSKKKSKKSKDKQSSDSEEEEGEGKVATKPSKAREGSVEFLEGRSFPKIKDKAREATYDSHPIQKKWFGGRIHDGEVVQIQHEKGPMFSKSLTLEEWQYLLSYSGSFINPNNQVILFGWGDPELHRKLVALSQQVLHVYARHTLML